MNNPFIISSCKTYTTYSEFFIVSQKVHSISTPPNHLCPHASCTSSSAEIIKLRSVHEIGQMYEYRSSHKMWWSADTDLRPIDRSIPSFLQGYMHFDIVLRICVISGTNSSGSEWNSVFTCIVSTLDASGATRQNAIEPIIISDAGDWLHWMWRDTTNPASKLMLPRSIYDVLTQSSNVWQRSLWSRPV